MRTVWMGAVLGLVVAGLAFGQGWADPGSWAKVAEPKSTMNVVYFAPGDTGYTPGSQTLDVFESAAAKKGEKAPVLLFVHGGGWHLPDGRPHWTDFRPFLAAGFTVVNVGYRLMETAPAPAAIQDVRCALTWIRANAEKYNLDPERVVTDGHSAGGHLALLAAVLPPDNSFDLPQCKAATQAKVVAVLDYYGPYHLEPDQPGAFLSASTAKFMGPNPKPDLLTMEKLMSPSTYVHKGMQPVFLVQGDADPIVPYQASVTADKEMTKAGVVHKFDTVPGGGHGHWTAEENDRVNLDALQFLQANEVIGIRD